MTDPGRTALRRDASGTAARRILVVEDEFHVAELIAELLRELDYEVIGPAADLSSACGLLDGEAPDGAIIDINLRGELSFPLVAACRERGLPCMLVTGYSDPTLLTEQFSAIPILNKPFRTDELKTLIAEVFPTATC